MLKNPLSRRHVLKGLGLATAATTLTGCKAMAPINQSLGGALGGILENDLAATNHKVGGLKPWGGDDQTKAAQAQRIIQPMLEGRPSPLIGSPLAHPDELYEAEREWQTLHQRAASTGETNLNEHIKMSLLATPILAQMAVQKMGKYPVAQEPLQVSNGSIVIPPGSSVKLRLAGACMDDGLPAPNLSEPLTLRPSSDYVPQGMRSVYEGINKQYAQGEINKTDYQYLVWSIRNTGVKDSSYVNNLNAQHQAILNRAAPGGYRTLMTQHQMTAMNPMNDLVSSLKSSVGEAMQINLNGTTMSFGDLLQQGGAEQAVDAMLGDILQRPAPSTQMPGVESSYTMLTPYVAARAMASPSNRLDAEVTLMNAGLSEFTFNPGEWIGESRRDVQRIAISPLIEQSAVLPSSLGPNADVGRVGELMLSNLANYGLNDSISDTNAGISTPVGAKVSIVEMTDSLGGRALKFLQESSVARTVLDNSPVLGNLFGLYEAVMGHHVLEPLNKSSMSERALAVLGVIPGGRQVATATNLLTSSSKAIELTRKAVALLDKVAESTAVTIYDRAQTLRDLAWWETPEGEQLLSEDSSVRLDNRIAAGWGEAVAIAVAH